MLKILAMFMSFIFIKNIYLLIPISCLFIIIILMNMMNFNISVYDNFFFNDNLSLVLINLTLISYLLIIISSNDFDKIIKTISPIMMILIFAFSCLNMMSFYILFELVLIPTMILIMTSGKQPERLQASIYLMLYTILASLPLFMVIINMSFNKSFIIPILLLNNLSMMIPVILAFLVKSPMFLTHLWLPKAHVEAPLEGSMILAAVLLKLGGYGLIRFIPLCLKKINYMSPWIFSISMIGATATGLNCIRQKDLKSLIAYSSVAHMALVILGIFSFNYLGMTGAVLMMIAHGLSSSALFLLVNDSYIKYHSRNILSFKGMISIFPNIIFWWFMFMAINISAPPSINTLSEIFIMMSMILWQKFSMIMIFFMSISVTIFSMMMFLNISHNKNKMNPATPSPYKIMFSLFSHMIPLIILIPVLEIFMI